MKHNFRLKVPRSFRGLDNPLAECEWYIWLHNSLLALQLKRDYGIELKTDYHLPRHEKYWVLKYEYDADVDLRPYIRQAMAEMERSFENEVWPRFLSCEL